MTQTVRLCAVTRLEKRAFLEQAWLARSLRSIPKAKRPRIHLHAANSGSGALGLPEVYNQVLAECDDDDILAMVHDDVYIHEWLLVDRLREALQHYDVVGVAGSAAPDYRHPSWLLRFDEALNPTGPQPDVCPSGAVGHQDPQTPVVSFYGETPKPCLLLDGLFMAVAVGRVRAAGLQFDERFRFHCYDIDFCRSATQANLRIGTWPLNLTHQSAGNFASETFQTAARTYLEKWR
ncbi:MAG: hypothetical protein OXU20_17715 [Myxococcales bacterium]|nr:hypothetical protein [Myxococcales bacterium]MDD9971888.1 hypothetical protein [Myxococcales bacterium]